jgi:hypothetical protein
MADLALERLAEMAVAEGAEGAPSAATLAPTEPGSPDMRSENGLSNKNPNPPLTD